MLAAAFKNFVRKSTRASKPNAIAGSRQAAFSTERTYEDAPPLLIRNGTVVNHDAIFKADVLTQEGKIIKVGQISKEEVPKNAKEVDATGRYVILGVSTPPLWKCHLWVQQLSTTTIMGQLLR